MSDEDFKKLLLETFREEAREHIDGMIAGLLELESAPNAQTAASHVEAMFRQAHSLKGAARAVNARNIEGICQQLETHFAEAKKQKAPLQAGLIDLLHRAADLLVELVNAEPEGEASPAYRDVIQLLMNYKSPEDVPAQILPPVRQAPLPVSSGMVAIQEVVAAPAPVHAIADSVRVPTSRLDAMLRQTEQIFSACTAQQDAVSTIRKFRDDVAQWRRSYELVKSELERKHIITSKFSTSTAPTTPQRLSAKSSRLLQNHLDIVSAMEGELGIYYATTKLATEKLRAHVDSLLYDVKHMQLLPLATLLQPYAKVVRDLAKENGKEVQFVFEDEGLEVDKRILEVMRDPLMHLIRNSVDHGIEPAADRQQRGKPARGTIKVTATRLGADSMMLRVEDDGQGIAVQEVREKAVKLGAISSADAAVLGDESTLKYIFHSGLSTSPMLTEISGRGLGLAIVSEKAEALGGTVRCSSTPGTGTAFEFKLPLTLSTLQVLQVRQGGVNFLLPLASVTKAVRVKSDEIGSAAGLPTLTHAGKVLALVRLEDILELPPQESPPGPRNAVTVLVLHSGDFEVGIEIDSVAGEREVLLKKLGPQLKRVPNIMGAAIDTGGQVTLVLNPTDIVRAALTLQQPPKAATDSPREKRRVLIAEDSVTSRMLLRDILTGAGYHVETAVDGADALEKLRLNVYDALVSDVDMPRMNGFELTAKIRNDKHLADLPVILVTSLASPEDRAHGLNVGASAYVVKSSFDQSDLLSILGRFV